MTQSVLCVGLDPTIDHVPPQLRPGSDSRNIGAYLAEIISIAASLVPVIKPQFAHYAKFGVAGLMILKDLIAHARSLGLLVILDGKRSDIGDTMELYGHEPFEVYGADACTLGGPYFGPTFWPAWKPWLQQSRMCIQMVRTSNSNKDPDDDLQMLTLKSGLRVYEHVARRVGYLNAQVMQETDGRGAVGAVVGATHPDEAVRCRELAGDDVFFLVPGYGAQGGGADGAVAGLINSRRELMGTVNSSRGITLNSWWDKDTQQPRQGDPLDLVEQAIKDANADLNAAIRRNGGVWMS